MENANMCL